MSHTSDDATTTLDDIGSLGYFLETQIIDVATIVTIIKTIKNRRKKQIGLPPNKHFLLRL